jgi:hypothetical protein
MEFIYKFQIRIFPFMVNTFELLFMTCGLD